MPVHEIINLPMDEFNERLSKYDLSETQLSLIRDIRRRGKNKVAAQNCRKRKLDQILCLADEVKEVRKRKDRLYQEREMALQERKHVQSKFSALHRHIFQVKYFYINIINSKIVIPLNFRASLTLALLSDIYLLGSFIILYENYFIYRIF